MAITLSLFIYTECGALCHDGPAHAGRARSASICAASRRRQMADRSAAPACDPASSIGGKMCAAWPNWPDDWASAIPSSTTNSKDVGVTSRGRSSWMLSGLKGVTSQRRSKARNDCARCARWWRKAAVHIAVMSLVNGPGGCARSCCAARQSSAANRSRNWAIQK